MDAGEAAKGIAMGQPPLVEGQSRTRDGVIFVMMVLVSLAIAGMLHLQAGLNLVLSALGGLAALGVSVTANSLAGRSAEVARLRLEIARLELELARVKTQGMPLPGSKPGRETEAAAEAPPARPAPASVPPEARWDTAAARRARMTPPGGANSPAAPQHPGMAGPSPMPPAASAAPAAARAPHSNAPQTAPAASSRAGIPGRPEALETPAPAPREPQAKLSPIATDDLADIPAWAAPSEAQGNALREDWEANAHDHDSSPRAITDTAPRQDTARQQQSRTIEADLELVQRKIKALADEVNANEAARAATPAEAPAAAIDDSISALRSTAERMKPTRKGFSARPVYSDLPPPPSPTAPKAPTVQAPRAPQPAPQPPSYMQAPANSGPHPASTASLAPGTLPSLDALIPATAQPIAVSNPTREPPRAQSEPPAARHDRERSPAARSEMAPPQETARPQPEPARRAPEAPPASRQPEPQRPVQQPARISEPSRAPVKAEPAPSALERRATPERRQVDPRIAQIAAAIESRRMDVFLNPIVGLGDYAVTHFEVAVRLKADSGAYIDDVQSTLALNSTDMLALFDIERLERTARVGEQLEARGKTGSLLSPTAGHSMTDGQFLEAFAQTFEARTSISGQLVLTFTQADVESFGAGTWQALGDMHSFGFRFAIEQVTHLGMDFAGLAERGFAFVKLPAEAFLDGLPAGHGMVPPADICRHLSGAGLTLVVESIDDDQLLARVFGFGALFGQGSLFGGSRQITLDALGPKRAA